MDKKSADHSKNEENMPSENGFDPKSGTNGQNNENLEDRDLQEMADVDQSIDELNSVMDHFELRADNIIGQLKDLLNIMKNPKDVDEESGELFERKPPGDHN